MCGIAGIYKSSSSSLDGLDGLAMRMAAAIQHRGPDDAGVWVDSEKGIAFGHRRLSIVDLSPAGHQPMHSSTGRFVIAFNGEIYNHLELRADLAAAGAAPCWRGHSDTETLLACFEFWGIESTLQKSVGMFAIALWDSVSGTLFLARDRFGEKPLYYGWVNGALLFGSELKALRALPGFANPVSREALALYMRFTYIPAPYSIYQGIYKLEPGCLLIVSGQPPESMESPPLRPPSQWKSLRLVRWWSLLQVVETGARNPMLDEQEALEALEARLSNAVRLQSLADVPLGAFLSGGVDSSVIVSLMQKQSCRRVDTFTIGFEDAGFDESPYSRAVAQHLGTNHSEVVVTATEARAVICRLPGMYDEPFGDSSQVPTHLVCNAARQSVTVALSGDAGDELFGGYNRYFWGPRIWRYLSWLPFSVRATLGRMIADVPVAGWGALEAPLNALLSGTRGVVGLGGKAHKLATRLRTVRTMEDLYLSLVSEWQDPAQLVRGQEGAVVEPASLLGDPLPSIGVEDATLRMMYRDCGTYLPDDILCKVDRASMSVSLETRVPFLDHRVVELAWQLPLSLKIRDNVGKWALRQVLYKYVPRELIDRPKSGFGIPVGQWIRGPLRPWAESLLEEVRLTREGFFNPAPIRQRWAEHLSGQRDHTPSLWSVLMFQAWLEANS